MFSTPPASSAAVAEASFSQGFLGTGRDPTGFTVYRGLGVSTKAVRKTRGRAVLTGSRSMVLGICLMPGIGLPSWRSLIISAKAMG